MILTGELMLDKAELGLIDREGRWYGCDFACHYRMLCMLKGDDMLEDFELEKLSEQAGWIRVTNHYSSRVPRAIYQPSEAQWRTLEAKDLLDKRLFELPELPKNVKTSI